MLETHKETFSEENTNSKGLRMLCIYTKWFLQLLGHGIVVESGYYDNLKPTELWRCWILIKNTL